MPLPSIHRHIAHFFQNAPIPIITQTALGCRRDVGQRVRTDWRVCASLSCCSPRRVHCWKVSRESQTQVVRFIAIATIHLTDDYWSAPMRIEFVSICCGGQVTFGLVAARPMRLLPLSLPFAFPWDVVFVAVGDLRCIWSPRRAQNAPSCRVTCTIGGTKTIILRRCIPDYPPILRRMDWKYLNIRLPKLIASKYQLLSL